jgi:Ca2+-binding RTX toxin-like protein
MVTFVRGTDANGSPMGAGDDTMIGDPPKQSVPSMFPGALVLNDSINGGFGLTFVIGGDGNDTMTGAGTLFGGSGDDFILTVDRGFNQVNGNAGNDTIIGHSTSEWLLGGQGNDLIELQVNSRDIVNGGQGDDTITANTFVTTGQILHGGQGNDVIRGGAGNDQIFGDLGDNTVTGGRGADTFHESGPGGAHTTITDFNRAEGDRLDVGAGHHVAAVTQTQTGVDVVVTADPGVAGGGDTFSLLGATTAGLGPTSGWIISF